jgi:glycosyltransferase involved in cell wall biosynthesis
MPEDSIPWPLRWIVDEHGRDTGFAMLRRGIPSGRRTAFEKMAAAHRMIGFTHFGSFPLFHEAYDPRAKARTPKAGAKPDPQAKGRSPEEGWQRPEVQACEAWAHCFRDPDRYLPPSTPRMLMSGSDFVNEQERWQQAYGGGRPGQRWDLVYSCPPTWLNELQKNWDLAKSCALRLAGAGVRIVMVGRTGVPGLPSHPNIDYLPMLSLEEFMRVTASSRAAFLPNCWDASPRVLTESLAVDVPVLVNRRILGGWKYVTTETGVFFDDEDDVVDAYFALLDAPLHPRDWLLGNGYGRDGAARRLAGELRALGGPGRAGELTYALPTSEPPLAA